MFYIVPRSWVAGATKKPLREPWQRLLTYRREQSNSAAICKFGGRSSILNCRRFQCKTVRLSPIIFNRAWASASLTFDTAAR